MNKFIRHQRIKAGMTQTELAKKMKVHQSLISHLELGRDRCMTMETMMRMAEALGVEPVELFAAYVEERKNCND